MARAVDSHAEHPKVLTPKQFAVFESDFDQIDQVMLLSIEMPLTHSRALTRSL